jgi:hypothetical protein
LQVASSVGSLHAEQIEPSQRPFEPLFWQGEPLGPAHDPLELELELPPVDEELVVLEELLDDEVLGAPPVLLPPAPPVPDEEAEDDELVVEVDDEDACVVEVEPPAPEWELPHADAPASGTTPSAVKVMKVR